VANTLLLYSTNYGLSKSICERIQASLQRRGERAEVHRWSAHARPQSFDAIVIGASIRHGKHSPAVLEFIRAHRALLESSRARSFGQPRARKPLKNTRRQSVSEAAGRAIALEAEVTGRLRGELDYSRYGPSTST